MDLRLAKVLRFGNKRLNVGLDLYNLFNANTATTYRNGLRCGDGRRPVDAADGRSHRAGDAVQRAVRFLMMSMTCRAALRLPAGDSWSMSALCRHAGGAVGLSDRHDHLRPGPRLERLHGAVAAQHASGDRHRHERQRRQAVGRLRQLRRRSGARVPGRRRHRGERRQPAAPGIARARRARLRRQGPLALRSQPADPDARRQTIWAARQHHDWQRDRLPGRLLLAGGQARRSRAARRWS